MWIVLARPFLVLGQFYYSVGAGVLMPPFLLIGLLLAWKKIMAASKVTHPDITTAEALYVGLLTIVSPLKEHLLYAPLNAWNVLLHGKAALRLNALE